MMQREKIGMNIHLLTTNRADKNMMSALEGEFLQRDINILLVTRYAPNIPPPDALVVLGDRMETLPIIAHYVHASVPIVHLHAHETTSHSADNKYRAAITAMADLALNPMEYGSIGYQLALDANTDPLSYMPDRYALITLHPWLNCPDLNILLRQITSYCEEMRVKPYISTGNKEEGSIAHSLQHVDFGPLFYNAMANATVIIGNSSSMIFEAAAYNTPCVLIGPRQEGRAYHSNINHVTHRDLIKEAIGTACTQERVPVTDYAYSGDYGNPLEATVERILAWLK